MALLAKGSRGEAVKALQKSLNDKGAKLAVDGIFGAGTHAALVAFQQQSKLVADGIAGPVTMAALGGNKLELSANMRAFLDTISHAEGTDRYGKQNGYDVIVGGGLFSDFSDHPRQSIYLPSYGIRSTAAGRYQILSRYWDHYKKQLGLPDFGPESQDRYAIQIIRERGAYSDVQAGRIAEAITKVSNIWASFPGAGYGQREVAAKKLIAFYKSRGGVTA